MSWNTEELAQAKVAFLASNLKTEITSIFSSDNSNTIRIRLPIKSLELACEKEIDEEVKMIQLLTEINSSLGWLYQINFLTGTIEFYGQ